ncbi:helix-turn-helix domain-containing protein [Mycolicibacterium hippocampi]|uniref:Putative transcriptional regulatory protein n=1 Tax=Mycolicibacterium hippocampi TaxID=659824 RepID=A0A850PS64_9MYCO|nr:putative transcriptional regulatory protein [Mycolicibacterium hippocampi]
MSREGVLAVLRGVASALTIPQIADELGVHPNTVRFHLDTLVTEGRVERVEPDRGRPGRPPLMFRAVRGMDPGGTRRYRVLAEILTSALAGDRNASAKALEAGRAWARRVTGPTRKAPGAQQSITRLVELLDDLGFAPQRREAHGQEQIGLRHCPFLELAQDRSAVVCPIHLGLMQGALAAWRAPVTVERLDPFVEPDLCLAHLASSVVAS